MKTSLRRCWRNSLGGNQPAGRIVRARPRRQPLFLEPLEDRVLLSLTPQMVLDINTNTASSSPSQMVTIGSTSYFTADDGVNGVELWKTDGTAAGTALVKDIQSGSAQSYPGSLTNVNGTLFFTANDGTHGFELWKSDGTAANTVLVKDIYSGANGSGPHSLTNVNGTLYFSAHTDAAGYELWKSDGTAAGTTLVKDMKPGWESSNPSNLTNAGGTLFFSSHDYFGAYSELWKSDGTAAGTVLVKSYTPKPNVNDAPSNLTSVNGTLYFSAYDVTHGLELWKSDGTAAGTVLVEDIQPGSFGAYPSSLTNVNGILYFSTVQGQGLWRSDGTAAGTTLVKDAYYPLNLTNVNGTVFFSARNFDSPSGGEALWKSDGTAAGTVVVKDIYPGPTWSALSGLTNVNGTLFFTANDGASGAELWKSDGTAAGTALVQDIAVGFDSSYPGALTNVNGTLMFAAKTGSNGVELWRSDGSAAGTTLVKDINARTFASYPSNLTDVNGTLYFAANDGIHGEELWKSDGTVAGTTLVKDIYPGSGWIGNWYYGYYYQANSSSPSNLTNVNGTLFFTANDGRGGWTLWKSDGTEAGTVPVNSLWYPSNLTDVNGTLFFMAGDGEHGYELWKSDGTAAGTTLVKDIYPGFHYEYGYYGTPYIVPNSSNPGDLTNVNGTLFFTATDGTTGYELWKSDGTATGTVPVKDIRPGGNSSYLGNLTDVNGTLFFRANDGLNGTELWKSDGTAAGTALVKDIRAGSNGSSPNSLTDVNGTLFFTAYDDTAGNELWKSDGTASGTVRVKDIYPGNTGSPPTNLTNVNGTLYFSANDAITGAELWKSDGTAAGTVLVKDIHPRGDSSPASLTSVNGVLYFTAYNDSSGTTKVWRSDGTAAGTVLVADLAAGALTQVNGTLFFTADDGIDGRELWMVVEDNRPSLTIGDATVTEGHSGTRSVTFAVTLSASFDQPVTVAYATADATAAAGSDYQAISGTLTFVPGQTSTLVTVMVSGDRLGEPNETFLVNLSAATNAAVADGRGVGTIVDDEPRITIGDATVTEGNTGTTTAVFTVSLNQAYDEPVSVNFATSAGGSDFQSQSGSVTIPAGQTSAAISVAVYSETIVEETEYFAVDLTGSSANAVITSSHAQGTIIDDDVAITKFYVVDASSDKTFEYDVTGAAVENYGLRSGNNDPRGAASDASGQRVWVIDNDDYVYIYDEAGNPLGAWKAKGLSTPEGIASNGTDLWIVDRGSDRVYRFAGGANRTYGSASATSSFALNSGNRDAKGIETDGVHLWVVNDASTNKVFKYTLSGALVGSWTISGNNTTPTGITLDPSNPSDIWIVDSGRDQVFQYTAAANRTSGSQSASAVFNLASGNSNPQGIADPPPSSETSAADSHGLSVTAEGLMLAAVDQIFSKEFPLEGAFNQEWESFVPANRGLNVAVQRFIPDKPTIPPNPVRLAPAFALSYCAAAELPSAPSGLPNAADELVPMETHRLSANFFALLGNSSETVRESTGDRPRSVDAPFAALAR